MFFESVFVKFLKIYITNNVLFIRLIRKSNYTLFTIIFKDIKKILIIKSSVDLVILLFFEYHEFLNVFSREIFDILLKHQFYNYKIQLKANKTSNFNSLYKMF